jgi:hypothetical protein
MSETAALNALAERFAHPSVRVLVRELSHLARDLERGALAWPRRPPALAQDRPVLPGLESIETALHQPPSGESRAVDHNDWASFARAVLSAFSTSPAANQYPAGAPHPVSVIALRLIWGAERFSELPTVVLKPPPISFLEHLARLPAPEPQAPSVQLDHAISTWLQERLPPDTQRQALLPIADVRGFVRLVAACRVVGQMRSKLILEDVAAGYLAWARVLRANLEQLSAISSGWWSSTGRQPGRRPKQGDDSLL